MNPAHLDYDALADLAEGLLGDSDAASATAHLDDCAECRERSADIADVSRILAETPIPDMPADLAARIDAAIAEESMAQATVVSLDQRRSRRPLWIFSAAAATVLAIGGGVVVGKTVLDSTISSGDSASTAQADPQRPKTQSEPEGNHAPSDGGGAGAGKPAGAPKWTASGTDYRAGTLSAQLRTVLGQRAGIQALQAGPPSAQLADCVKLVSRGATPVLVDTAKYEGKSATLIAFTGTATTLNVIVVGPKCSAQSQDIVAQTQVTR